MSSTNLIGALTAEAFLLSAAPVFLFRLAGRPQFGRWIGLFEFALAFPLVYLLIRAPAENRGALYFLQIACVLAWLIAELCLDYLFKLDFRRVRWMVICYVVLFFAAAGGSVGIASNAGSPWSTLAIITFFITAALAFIQRKVTGM